MVVSSRGRLTDHDRYRVAQLFYFSPTHRGRCDYQYLLRNDASPLPYLIRGGECGHALSRSFPIR